MSRVSDHAYQQIRTMILRTELAPGEQIREEQLALACGVSRTPVREALQRLEKELLIRRNDSQRSFVAEWSPADVSESFQLRAILEARATRKAAQQISKEQLDKLKFHNDKLEAAVSKPKPDIAKFLDHNRQFHAVIVEAAASIRLANMLTLIIEQPVVLRTAQQYDSENLLKSHHEHTELLTAFARHDGEWAEAIMIAHILRAFHVYSDARQRDLGGTDGEPSAW